MEAQRTRHLAQPIDDDTRLDARGPPFPVDGDHVRHVPREVEDDRVVHALSGEARPGAAREDRDSTLVRHSDDVLDIAGVAGKDHRDRLHLVDRRIGGIEQPGGAVDQHVALAAFEPARQFRR